MGGKLEFVAGLHLKVDLAVPGRRLKVELEEDNGDENKDGGEENPVQNAPQAHADRMVCRVKEGLADYE